MKRITASEARKNWFRLLDEVAGGEVFVLERKGRRLVVRREDSSLDSTELELPDYGNLLHVPDADEADRWSWHWKGPGQQIAVPLPSPDDSA